MKPIGSMYEISTHIYHQNQPNVDRYTVRTMDPSWDISFSRLQICPLYSPEN